VRAVAHAATGDRVAEHVRQLIETGGLQPGDRLPGERDLARSLGVSRPTVRSGLKALEAMGVVLSRPGAGTFIADGPPDLGREPLGLLAALHGFTPDEMFEARRVLEVGVAGLAAEHAAAEHLTSMAEELSEMFAALEQRRQTVAGARDLRESAEMHRRVFRAVRSKDPEAARGAMAEHLTHAQHAQAREGASGR